MVAHKNLRQAKVKFWLNFTTNEQNVQANYLQTQRVVVQQDHQGLWWASWPVSLPSTTPLMKRPIPRVDCASARSAVDMFLMWNETRLSSSDFKVFLNVATLVIYSHFIAFALSRKRKEAFKAPKLSAFVV